MKWQEVEHLPADTLLERNGSGRLVRLVEKNDGLRHITVIYLDNGKREERVDPHNFSLLKPPPGTVARTC
jgi:hypothetical protein